jgi:Holliday junction resolvase RusA-like endonuclease
MPESDGIELVSFQVLGKPEPQGSAKAWVPTDKAGNPYRRSGGRTPGGSIVVNVTSDNPELKKWRGRVAAEAEKAWLGREVLEDVSLEVEVHFFLKRPENHWRTGRNAHLLRDSAPAAPVVIPDADKLLRGVLDGLTGVVYKDDSLVTRCPPEKHYAVPVRGGDGVGCRIIVRRRVEQTALDLPADERERYVEPVAAEVDASQLAVPW